MGSTNSNRRLHSCSNSHQHNIVVEIIKLIVRLQGKAVMVSNNNNSNRKSKGNSNNNKDNNQ